MEKAIQVLNQMLADGVVEKFAAIYYLEPYQTDDIDVFVLPIVVGQGGLVSLEPIYTYLEKLGYHSVEEGVGILIEGWTVQFVPAFKSVQEEAVTQAERVAYGQTIPLFSRPSISPLNSFALPDQKITQGCLT